MSRMTSPFPKVKVLPMASSVAGGGITKQSGTSPVKQKIRLLQMRPTPLGGYYVEGKYGNIPPGFSYDEPDYVEYESSSDDDGPKEGPAEESYENKMESKIAALEKQGLKMATTASSGELVDFYNKVYKPELDLYGGNFLSAGQAAERAEEFFQQMREIHLSRPEEERKATGRAALEKHYAAVKAKAEELFKEKERVRKEYRALPSPEKLSLVDFNRLKKLPDSEPSKKRYFDVFTPKFNKKQELEALEKEYESVRSQLENAAKLLR